MVSCRAAVHCGSARRDGRSHGGWFVGHFLNPAILAQTKDVEVKWSIHDKRYEQQRYKYNKRATTMYVVLSGAARMKFLLGDREIIKTLRPGKYVIWGPLVPHKLVVGKAAEAFVVRWPSKDQDQVELDH